VDRQVIQALGSVVEEADVQTGPSAFTATSLPYVRCHVRVHWWSLTALVVAQIHKFRAENIAHYVHYAVSIRDVPLHRLKFLDEATFQSRSLRRESALSEKGRGVYLTSNHSIAESYTVTLV
jgi:hypothetical protein